MKTSLLVLLLAPALAFSQSPQPAQKPSARMTARVGATSLKRTNNFGTNYGSYELEITRRMRVDVEATTTNREAVKGVVRWYVIGKSLQKGAKREVLKSGEEPLTIEPKTTARLTLDSGPIDATDDNYAALGERYVSGFKIDGWALRLVDEKGVELSAASNTAEALEFMKAQAAWGMAQKERGAAKQ